MNQITILGTGRPNSSLNIYSEEVSKATGKRRLILLLSRDQMTAANSYLNKVVAGHISRFSGSGWTFNNLFGNFVFRAIKNELMGTAVHYTTFGLPLLTENEHDIVTIHDLLFLDRVDERYHKLLNFSKYFLDRFIDFENIITPSSYVRETLLEYGFNGEIEVIYHPINNNIRYLGNKESARRSLKLPEDKVLVLSVSTNLRRKNLGVVKETIEALGGNYRLVRVGTPVGDSITFSDLKAEQLNLVYNACDVLLFPTLAEGFGKPVIEAFGSGLPVVASNIEVMREISGDAALLVDPTVEGCVAGVRDALSMNMELLSRGLKRAGQFSWDRFSTDMNRYYSKRLEQN